MSLPITLWTKGFCCNSGRDMNSSTDKEPELSKSSFLNLKLTVMNYILIIVVILSS